MKVVKPKVSCLAHGLLEGFVSHLTGTLGAWRACFHVFRMQESSSMGTLLAKQEVGLGTHWVFPV